jgi:hypothetical protein
LMRSSDLHSQTQPTRKYNLKTDNKVQTAAKARGRQRLTMASTASARSV